MNGTTQPRQVMRRVLVVDDDYDLAELLREVLTYDNCEVDIATNGMEAMDRLHTGDYDAVDLRLDDAACRRRGAVQ